MRARLLVVNRNFGRLGLTGDDIEWGKGGTGGISSFGNCDEVTSGVGIGCSRVLTPRLRVISFVTLSELRSMLSKSADRSEEGGCGVLPMTYGRPLSVGAAFHCLFELESELKIPGRANSRFFFGAVSCSRYSRGTNSSNKRISDDVRGSPAGGTGGRCVGSDLNST